MERTSVEYITKDIAAQRLGLSPRRVLELANEGKIRQEETYNAATRRRQTVLAAEDVDRLVAERTPGAALAVRPSALPPQSVALAPSHPSAFPPQSVASSTQTSANGQVPACAWFTLEEAASYTGLPAAFIVARIRNAALPALNVGVRAGGQWRVKRSDLDRIEGEIQAP